MSIELNIRSVKDRINSACQKAGRNPDTIKLIAVSKTVGAEQINAAINAGVTDIGENRVQEAWQKYQEVGNRAKWHFIGHLQTNKIKRVLQFADIIHSIDSFRLAEEVQQEALKINRDVDILIQVNTSSEESKYGVKPGETVKLVQRISELSNLKIKGLMTIGAFTFNLNVVRRCFIELNHLREVIKNENFNNVYMDELSMGMTNDFEIAIEEGATMLRIGRSIFGERN